MEKVIFFHNRNDYTGSTRVLFQVIKDNYDKEETRVVALEGIGFLSELEFVKWTYKKYPMFFGHRVPYLSGSLSMLYELLLALVFCPFYDVIYANTITQFIPAVVGRIYGKKVVYHIHEKFNNSTLAIRFYEYVFNHIKADRIFVSNYIKNAYKQRSDVVTKVVYNKLSKDFVQKIKITPYNERRLNTVTMLSSLTDLKGVPMFVNVASKCQDLEFILVSSADRNGIDNYFGSYNALPKNLTILSKQSDVHSWYQKSDVVVNLTNPHLCVESFGLTLIEAMAHAVPVLGPNVGGPIEIINGKNGLAVNVANIDDVITGIRKILLPDIYKEMMKEALYSSKRYI
jgi:glycosyltransferase involved in cell wall biosynthesis